MSVRDYSFGEVSELLAQRMDDLVVALGLKGHRQGGNFLPLNPTRADRNPGSFVISMGGQRAGRWDEYANDQYGDALDLVTLILFGDPGDRAARKHGMNWALRWLGLGNSEVMAGGTERLERARADAAERREKAEGDLAAMLAKKRRSAMSMWLGAQKLEPPGATGKSSPAWAYFNEARGLPLERLKRLPSAVKWTAGARHVESDRVVPAIVSGMFMPGGQLVAVHRIFLEPDGLSKIRSESAAKKIWPAGYRGAVIPISRGLSDLAVKAAAEAGCADDVYYCEGVEDGFTAALLAPEWRVFAVGASGNFEPQVPPDSTASVIVGRDNDPDPKVRRAVGEKIARFGAACRERGLPFFTTSARGVKDFNDMVRG